MHIKHVHFFHNIRTLPQISKVGSFLNATKMLKDGNKSRRFFFFGVGAERSRHFLERSGAEQTFLGRSGAEQTLFLMLERSGAEQDIFFGVGAERSGARTKLASLVVCTFDMVVRTDYLRN